MQVTEQELWYYLDVIAVRASGAGDKDKADAAVAVMGQLYKPSPNDCARMYRQGYGVREPM